jgi:hypothetical protein
MVANNSYFIQCYHDIQTMNKQPRGEREIRDRQIVNGVNGVNVTKLSGAVEEITSNPMISQFNFCAKGKWINGGHTERL